MAKAEIIKNILPEFKFYNNMITNNTLINSDNNLSSKNLGKKNNL